MSFRGLLTNTCTIRTWTEASTSATGHEVGSWGDTYTDVPCRFYGYQQGRERYREAEIAIADFQLDVQGDQAVTDAERVVFNSTTYQVTTVRPVYDRNGDIHHKVVYLKLVG